ncbi:MAG: PDZ domain-containing protein [Actinobacteria bacterium]|nr:PDZ domain-containing protein [Actinomycetota bacterium]
MVVLQYILAIVGFSLIILVHEFGHFIFAKLSGMHVLEFFIGFGPKILKFKSKKTGTMYGISAIPLGGYNKILGFDRNETVPEDLKEKVFYSKPFYKKFFVISGGGLFNIIFSIILIIIFLSMGVFTAINVVDYVEPGSPAEIYGFQVGDRVVELEGKQIDTWEDFSLLVKSYPDKEVMFKIERDGNLIAINARLAVVDGSGFLGIAPKVEKIMLSPLQVLRESFKMVWELSVTYLKLFGMLVSGRIPFEYARPSSPIGVISIFQQSAAMGFQNFILFVAIVSVLIAFGNFLPIMPVDGGHLLIIIIEAIRKKPVSKKTLEIYGTIGMVIIISLLVVGLVFDIISPFNIQKM